MLPAELQATDLSATQNRPKNPFWFCCVRAKLFRTLKCSFGRSYGHGCSDPPLAPPCRGGGFTLRIEGRGFVGVDAQTLDRVGQFFGVVLVLLIQLIQSGQDDAFGVDLEMAP